MPILINEERKDLERASLHGRTIGSVAYEEKAEDFTEKILAKKEIPVERKEKIKSTERALSQSISIGSNQPDEEVKGFKEKVLAEKPSISKERSKSSERVALHGNTVGYLADV